MSDLRELYQSVILDHNKHPRNFGTLAHATSEADGNNPLCGDKLHLEVDVQDGVIRDVAFRGEGCAISTASASVMTEAVKGSAIDDARELFEAFYHVVKGEVSEGEDASGPVDLGKLAVFAGVSEFPVRVKCATLCWHTLLAALESRDTATTE